MTDLTPETLDELERLEKAATAKAPWMHDILSQSIIGYADADGAVPKTVAKLVNRLARDFSNADLTTALRNHAVALIAAARERQLAQEATRAIHMLVSKYGEVTLSPADIMHPSGELCVETLPDGDRRFFIINPEEPK